MTAPPAPPFATPYPTEVGTAMTGARTSPARTLNSAPSMPATAMTTGQRRMSSSFAIRRQSPAPHISNHERRLPKERQRPHRLVRHAQVRCARSHDGNHRCARDQAGGPDLCGMGRRIVSKVMARPDQRLRLPFGKTRDQHPFPRRQNRIDDGGDLGGRLARRKDRLGHARAMFPRRIQSVVHHLLPLPISRCPGRCRADRNPMISRQTPMDMVSGLP